MASVGHARGPAIAVPSRKVTIADARRKHLTKTGQGGHGAFFGHLPQHLTVRDVGTSWAGDCSETFVFKSSGKCVLRELVRTSWFLNWQHLETVSLYCAKRSCFHLRPAANNFLC